MGKKQSGVNTKVEAGNARKAANKAAKDAKAAAAAAAAESAEWSKGADMRGEKRRAEEERKRQEQEAKKEELKKLQALEEHALAEDKSSIRKFKTKDKKELNKPWEEALKPAVKKNNKGSRVKTPTTPAPAAGGKMTQAMMAAAREAEEAKNKKSAGKNDIQFDTNSLLRENRNRDISAQEEARDIDAALDLLSVGDKDLEKHPERRAKAAYKAYEEAMMPQLREEYPGLKLSQYKQKLFEMWRRAPENPLNQESLAYNAKKQ